jgi:hypothetical protein
MPEVTGSQQPALWAEGKLPKSEVVTAPVTAATDRGARLKPVNRNQFLLRTVDVDKLVERDHLVRAIWDLTGQLDLRGFTPRWGRLKEWQGAQLSIRVCSSVYGFMPTRRGKFCSGGGAALCIPSLLSVADGM